MNATHITLLIALAAVGLAGAILLAAIGADIPDVIQQTVSYIIAGLFGGAAGVGAHGVYEQRQAQLEAKANEDWRSHGVE
jgi:hypothetical protein